MELKNLKKGLEIILKYVTDDTTIVGSDYDVVYVVGISDVELPIEEEKALKHLGFRKGRDSWEFFT